jgi:hypothetical protein
LGGEDCRGMNFFDLLRREHGGSDHQNAALEIKTLRRKCASEGFRWRQSFLK